MSPKTKYENINWMNGWMTYHFMPFSAVFQAYQDNGWMIMKGCEQWSLVYDWKDFWLETGTARSEGQRVTYWSTRVPNKLASSWQSWSQLPYFFGYKTEFFSFQNNLTNLDLWDYLGRVKHIIAKLHRTDLVICSHSRKRKTLFYSQINTVS